MLQSQPLLRCLPDAWKAPWVCLEVIGVVGRLGEESEGISHKLPLQAGWQCAPHHQQPCRRAQTGGGTSSGAAAGAHLIRRHCTQQTAPNRIHTWVRGKGVGGGSGRHARRDAQAGYPRVLPIRLQVYNIREVHWADHEPLGPPLALPAKHKRAGISAEPAVGAVKCDPRPPSYRCVNCCSLCSWYFFSAALNAVPDSPWPPSYILAFPTHTPKGNMMDLGGEGRRQRLAAAGASASSAPVVGAAPRGSGAASHLLPLWRRCCTLQRSA